MTTRKTEPPAQPPPTGTAWDELRLDSGALRPHWQSLMASLGALGRDERGIRVENSRRILRVHGGGRAPLVLRGASSLLAVPHGVARRARAGRTRHPRREQPPHPARARRELLLIGPRRGARWESGRRHGPTPG